MYRIAFFVPGHYFTGDGAYRSKEGYYQITGRMDDVINISGHRLGTAEIEDALVRTLASSLQFVLCVYCKIQYDECFYLYLK